MHMGCFYTYEGVSIHMRVFLYIRGCFYAYEGVSIHMRVFLYT